MFGEVDPKADPPFFLVAFGCTVSKLDKIEAVVKPLIERHGCELVLSIFQREGPGWVLRLLIERKGLGADCGSGVDHQLCASISRDAGTALEVEDIIEQAYVLEVSSPGIERPLVRESDFERFAGRLAKVKLYRSIDGKKRFSGVINGICAGEVKITTDGGDVVVVPFEAIAKANLVFDPQRAKANVGEK